MREVTRGESGSLDANYGDRSRALRKAVAHYMNKSPLVLVSPDAPYGADVEELDGFRSDGFWFWSNAGAQMFEEGKIDLETEFVNHVIANQTPPKELSQSQFDDVLRFLVEG